MDESHGDMDFYFSFDRASYVTLLSVCWTLKASLTDEIRFLVINQI